MFTIIFWTFNTSMHNAHICTARKKLLQPNNFTPTPHHVLHRVTYLHVSLLFISANYVVRGQTVVILRSQQKHTLCDFC